MIIKRRLGEMLLESGLLTEVQLEKALAEHRKAGLKLGQYLARQGIVTELKIVDLLCRQMKIGRYQPEEFPIDLNIANVIPFDMAQKYQVAPLMKKGHLITIAMTDPLYIDALDNIEALTNCEVVAVVCTEAELTNLHGILYAAQSGLGGVMESLAGEQQPAFEKAEDEQDDEINIAVKSSVDVKAPTVVRLVTSIFANAIQERASDIHISPQHSAVQVRFRVDGKLHNMPAPPKHIFLAMVARIKILADMDITLSRVPQDGRFTMKMGNRMINVRASTVPTVHGENLVLRILDTSSGILTLEGLGMSEADVERIKSIIHKPYGMILSTGPTGSGKTSSLYAILQELNTPDINIITLEDPVEYKIDSIRQIQLNVKAGMTFASGLRAILRQDPDVIMVGEIRDGETASIAIRAAQTGHRVLSTIHTNDAAGAVARLVDMGIEPFLVSSVLLVSFAQRLLRTVCPYCKEPYRPPEKALAAWGLADIKDAVFMRGRGCQQCIQTGYKGRTGIFEVLVNDEAIQEMILTKTPAHEITREAVSSGKMTTLQQNAARAVAKGLTTLEEAQATVMS